MTPKFENISLSVVMPTYNEAENIVPLIKETLKVVREHFSFQFLEILVVDDNSPDETWKLAENCGENSVKVIRRLENRGLRNSIWEGVQQAKGDIIVWMDCDFSHPPRYIPQIISCVLLGWDIVVNSRYVAGGEDVREGKGTWLQRILSWILNRITWVLLGTSFKDYTSGFIAVQADVVKSLGLNGDYGEYFIDFIYRAIKRGNKILELPYANEPRVAGESKTGSNFFDYARLGVQYIITLLMLRIKGHL